MGKDFNAINIAFEKAVIKLQENLQYLVNNDKVNARFIAIQNGIIKALIEFQNQTEDIISELEMENMELARRKMENHENLKDSIWCLEAICIIHGILDFPMWMAMGKNHLIQEAKHNYKDGAMYLPCVLKEKLEKVEGEDKKVINDVLFGRGDKEYQRIEQLIRELRKKRKNEPKI
jgi:hypothetical protein